MKLPRFTVELLASALSLLMLGPAARSAEPEAARSDTPMITVLGGDYLRGRSYDWPDQRFKWYPNPAKDDTPIGPVVVNTFSIDESEVANEQYAAFVKATGHRTPFHWIDGKTLEGTAKQPVANVSWDDAVAYCSWQGKRLPTEAEWEKACRSGKERERYPWGDEDPTEELAHFGSADGPVDVCSKKKSPTGLCDMSGNVWEWVHDWYDTNYYADYSSPEETENPRGPEKGLYRVIRGGGWFEGESELFMTCSYRSWALPGELTPTVGFRCARDGESTSPPAAAESAAQ
jgi:formylglycine-generating enzyme required for sulfatase activity